MICAATRDRRETHLCASSGFADRNKAPAECKRIGHLAKAVADRLIFEVHIHIPAAKPLVEPIENTDQLVIEREGHLKRIVPVHVVSDGHAPPLSARNVLYLFFRVKHVSSCSSNAKSSSVTLCHSTESAPPGLGILSRNNHLETRLGCVGVSQRWPRVR